MHCADEHLLAYLDGELSPWLRLRIRRHLKSCWNCRTRLAQCEQQIHDLSLTEDEVPFPDSDWAKGARRRLASGIAAIEMELATAVPAPSSPWPWRAVMAGAGLALILTGWFVWTRHGGRAGRPAELMARTAAAERVLLAQPVHQAFEVEIAEIRPSPRTVAAELEIWSEGPHGRFFSRLQEPGGLLKQALWRRASGAEFVYLPASADHRVQRPPRHEAARSLASLGDRGIAPTELEASFLLWLQTRSWQPISFATPMSSWAAQDGTAATAERIRLPGGAEGVRITAKRLSAQMIAIVTLEVDSQTYRPRLQRIRFELPERTVEFRLTTKTARNVTPAEVAASLPLEGQGLAATASEQAMPPQRPGPTHTLPLSVAAVADPEEVSQEVAAHYVLHLAGACLGEPVRVSGESGAARVWRLNGDSSSDGESLESEARLESVLAVLSNMRDATGEPPRNSTEALRHARALERLSESFPASRIQGIPERSRALLSSMVRDHADSILRTLGPGGVRRSKRPVSFASNGEWQDAAAELSRILTQLATTDQTSATDEYRRRAVLRALSRLLSATDGSK